jgi:DNA-binding beta-propeller fold protein YncE
MNQSKFIKAGTMLLIAVLAAIPSGGSVSASGPNAGGVAVATGLNGPMGVLVAPDGNVWVAETGIGGPREITLPNPESGQMETAKLGDSARILKIGVDGKMTEVVSLPSVLMGEEGLGANRLAILDGIVYVTNGGWLEDIKMERIPLMAAVVKVDMGKATEVANTWDFEKAQNPDKGPLDTHPYGLAVSPDKMLLVADAAGNDLLKVDPTTGKVQLVATFPDVPGPMPNPEREGKNLTEAVPTGIAVDANGNLFVSLLPGAPMMPGTAKVVKVAPDGTVSDYATGLTTLTDLRMGPDGNLYAVSIGQMTEQGPAPNSGALIRVKPGMASEVILDALSLPTSVDFTKDGDAYVTINGAGQPGSGEVQLFKGATTMSGTPLPPLAPAPAGTESAAPTEGGQK